VFLVEQTAVQNMDRKAVEAALEPHAKRPIRAFLADPKVAGTPTEAAFWFAYYDGVCCPVLHEHARLAEREMTASAHPVATVLEKGGRP